MAKGRKTLNKCISTCNDKSKADKRRGPPSQAQINSRELFTKRQKFVVNLKTINKSLSQRAAWDLAMERVKS